MSPTSRVSEPIDRGQQEQPDRPAGESAALQPGGEPDGPASERRRPPGRRAGDQPGADVAAVASDTAAATSRPTATSGTSSGHQRSSPSGWVACDQPTGESHDQAGCWTSPTARTT